MARTQDTDSAAGESAGQPPRAKPGRGHGSGPAVGIVRLASLAAAMTAVVRELRLPRAERVWHGKVWGFLPYDFRPPRLDRIRQGMWSPSDPRLIVPQVFGIGWTVNFGWFVERLRKR